MKLYFTFSGSKVIPIDVELDNTIYVVKRKILIYW